MVATCGTECGGDFADRVYVVFSIARSLWSWPNVKTLCLDVGTVEGGPLHAAASAT